MLMPDKVIIPRVAPQHYKGIFQQLYDLQEPSSIALAAIRSIRSDIKKFGKEGSSLITSILPDLKYAAPNSPLREDVVDDIYDKLDICAGKLVGNKPHIHYAVEAIRQLLIRFEQGQFILDIRDEIEKERIKAIWISQVEEAPPCFYPKDATHDAIKQHISRVRTYMIEELPNDFLHTKKVSTSDLLEIDINLI